MVKPGGMVGIFDGDYASMTFAHEDAEKGRRYDEALVMSAVYQEKPSRHAMGIACLSLVVSLVALAVSYTSSRPEAAGKPQDEGDRSRSLHRCWKSDRPILPLRAWKETT